MGYAHSIYQLVLIRYDINPFSPRRAYRVVTHIEGEAYITRRKGYFTDLQSKAISLRVGHIPMPNTRMLRALLIYSSLGTTVRAASMDLPMEYQNTLSRLGSRFFASPRAA